MPSCRIGVGPPVLAWRSSSALGHDAVMTQQPCIPDLHADADIAEPARLRAHGSNGYGTLPSVVPLEQTVAEHPVPEPSGPASGGSGNGGEDGDGD